jgi:hypothetical protein
MVTNTEISAFRSAGVDKQVQTAQESPKKPAFIGFSALS